MDKKKHTHTHCEFCCAFAYFSRKWHENVHFIASFYSEQHVTEIKFNKKETYAKLNAAKMA